MWSKSCVTLRSSMLAPIYLLVFVGFVLCMLSSYFSLRFYWCLSRFLRKIDVRLVFTFFCFLGCSCFIFVICIHLRILVFCECFAYHRLFFCHFPWAHCIIWPPSIVGFWIPIWYLQIFPPYTYCNQGYQPQTRDAGLRVDSENIWYNQRGRGVVVVTVWLLLNL